MNRIFIISGALLLGLAQALVAATTGGPDFDSYRMILDRKPFGEITPAETSTTTSAPTDSLTKELEMRAIIDDGNNTLRVGFLDKKSNKVFYLGIGEKNEAYELVSVNYDEEEAVLKRGTESSIFNLKPNKTPSAAAPAPGALGGGFAPMSPSGLNPAQGFAPVPSADSRKPFFSDLKKKKFSPFRPVGTNAPLPFQTQSLDKFMKANSNAAPGFPGTIRPFESVNKTDGKGDTIDNLLRANPDAARQFAPLKPLAPNTAATEGALENFFTPNQAQPPQFAPLFPSPVPEDSGDNSEE